MAAWSEVRLGDLPGERRLDAEFWRPSFVANAAAVGAHPHLPLGELVTTFRKGIFYILASDYVDAGIPFYRSANVQGIMPRDNGLAFITPARDQTESKTSLCRGDVMLAKTGKNGASVVLRERCNVSQDVIAVKVRRDRINPFFLAVYLNSTPGQLELRRWFQGQVQEHLSLPDARRVLVPLLADGVQERTQQMVERAEKVYSAAAELYTAAECELQAELGLKPSQLEASLTYEAALSRTATAGRWDAEHFMPRFETLLDRIRETGRDFSLGNELEYCERGLQPEYSDDGEIAVINTKHMGEQFLFGPYERCTEASWRRQTKGRLRQHDVLVYSTGAYIGRTNCWFEADPAIGSNHVTIIRPGPNCNPIYLSLFLNSTPGRMQTDCHAHGSAQREIYPSDIRGFRVWLPPMKRQEEFAEKVLKARSGYLESFKLLDDAKRLVEDAIRAKPRDSSAPED